MATLAPSHLAAQEALDAMETVRLRRRKLSLYGAGLVLVALCSLALFAYGFDYYRLDLAVARSPARPRVGRQPRATVGLVIGSAAG